MGLCSVLAVKLCFYKQTASQLANLWGPSCVWVCCLYKPLCSTV